MMPQFPDDDEGTGMLPYKYVAIAIAVIFVGSIVVSLLGAQGFIPVNPVTTMGMAILLITLLVCCSAVLTIGSYSQKIPEYSEMEIKFDEAKSRFDDGEFEKALETFKALAGPRLNHKRALYYGALCYEALEDWEGMKVFCKAYLELKSKDKEVWEMLNRAHKRLFEYEEAEDALEKARKL